MLRWMIPKPAPTSLDKGPFKPRRGPHLPPLSCQLITPLLERRQETKLVRQPSSVWPVAGIWDIHVDQHKRAVVCQNNPAAQKRPVSRGWRVN
jgi:hypothetical protein